MRSASIAFAAFAILLGATGCAAQAEQKLTVEFSDGGSTHKIDVELPGVRCNAIAGQTLLGSDEPREITEQARFVATVRHADERHIIGIALDDDLWFLSKEPFELTDGGAAFTSVVGTVGRGADVASATDIVDDAATLTGSVHCTSGKLE